jgi:Ca-activated chloride channel homolog
MGRIRRKGSLARRYVSGCVTAIALVLWAGGSNAQEIFRVDVKLVRIIASVKNAAGGTVGGLSKEDFTILDNGVKQEIAVFDRHTSQPLSIALLIDTSGSTNKELKYEVEAVSRFLRAVFRGGNPEDRVALYSFNWQVTRHVDYSRRETAFDRTLHSLRGEAGTSMYDAIYLAADDISSRAGRHVIVVVTDGGDTVSAKTYHEALRAVHDADAVLYSILVMPITSEAGRNIGGENALTGLAQSTGGKVFMPGVNGLDMVFDEILTDLRTQYLLGFYPKGVPVTKEPFHKLSITANRPNLRVLSRTGYYGDFLKSDGKSTIKK